MKQETRERRDITKVLKALRGQDWLVDRMYQILQQGKQGLDGFLLELGRLFAETILELDREEQAGPDYRPKTPSVPLTEQQPSGSFRIVPVEGHQAARRVIGAGPLAECLHTPGSSPVLRRILDKPGDSRARGRTGVAET